MEREEARGVGWAGECAPNRADDVAWHRHGLHHPQCWLDLTGRTRIKMPTAHWQALDCRIQNGSCLACCGRVDPFKVRTYVQEEALD